MTTYYPHTGKAFMADDLLPCPFCGSEAELIFIGNDYTNERSVEIKCEDLDCRVSVVTAGIRADSKQVALWSIQKWNRRKDKEK